MQEQDFSSPSVGLGLTQHKERIGADYLGHILSQPCLNSQLDTNSSWTHTYHPVLNNFLTGTEDFQQRNVRTWSGSRQLVGALFWQIKEQLLWELLPGILYGWCWLIPYSIPCSSVFQALNRCFLMGQLTSSLRPAQTFGMVPISTPSLALTGGQLCHLVHSGTAAKLQRERGHSIKIPFTDAYAI